MRTLLSVALGATLLMASNTGISADKGEKKWDVLAAHGKPINVAFNTDEGTWLDLDVSPNGREIAFSMLGDIYLMPASGGNARRILGGAAFETQPRFSPDGLRLSFTSDRAGGDNIWTAKTDGSDLHQVTKESFRLLNNADWTPDGQYLIARKHFTSGRSLGAGEIWMYHALAKAGGGDGVQLTKRKNDQMDVGQPQSSPDGRYVYFSEDLSSGSSFSYNKNIHAGFYGIRRLDRETGELIDLVNLAGGAISPTPSPDGKTLAFVRRIREKTVLHVMDLDSGEIKPIYDGLSHDQQEAWAIFGPYTNFAFTPDSGAIVIWAKGKLVRVDVKSGAGANVAFSAKVEQRLDQVVRAQHRIEAGESFAPQMIRDVATSSDRQFMVFHAVGSLWKKRLPNGVPERLTRNQNVFEYAPSISPDGQSVVYVRFSDEALSSIERIDLASGKISQLTNRPAFYFSPRYSADGKKIVYGTGTGGNLVDFRFSQNSGIYVMNSDGSDAKRIAKEGNDAYFNADGSRVQYLTGAGSLTKTLLSVGLNADADSAARTVFNLKYVDFVVQSPDGKFVAFTEGFNAWVAPMPQSGAAIDLSKDMTAIPVAQVSKDVGSYLHWSADSKSLHWMVGKNYYSRPLTKILDFVPNAEKPNLEQLVGIDVGLSVPLDQPLADEIKAFKNARIIPMNGPVIENGTIVIKGRRILSVGKNVQVPNGATVIDAAGKTIIPGIVDTHAHANHFHNGPSPQANWAYYANLAFGITTMHDPSANTQEVFSQSELVKAGLNIAPRVYSTGTILYGADGDFRATVNSIDDARAHLRRLKAVGAFSVKSYNQPRRDQRQQINQAARELGMNVVMEGGSTFNHNLTMIMDGSTGIEHNLPVAPLYKDVLHLWKETDVRNTPTLVVTYGGLNGEYFYYARDNVWENEKLLKFFPREQIDGRSIRREKSPAWDYYHVEVAKAVKAAHDVGVGIQIGGHGQLQGIAPHWEIWMLVQGGMSNLNALKAATVDGADYLGLGADLGSLEAGKLADLVVLNSNPLENIEATADSAYVMVNGRLFDARDMSEIEGLKRPAPQFYWQRHGGVAGQSASQLLGPTAECHCPEGRFARPNSR
jgi:imidazolonepropionase-like amidohydrolase/Tol biopolymer transport system component